MYQRVIMQLTDADNPRVIRINLDLVEQYYRPTATTVTILRTVSGTTICVKETPEEIDKMITRGFLNE